MKRLRRLLITLLLLVATLFPLWREQRAITITAIVFNFGVTALLCGAIVFVLRHERGFIVSLAAGALLAQAIITASLVGWLFVVHLRMSTMPPVLPQTARARAAIGAQRDTNRVVWLVIDGGVAEVIVQTAAACLISRRNRVA